MRQAQKQSEATASAQKSLQIFTDHYIVYIRFSSADSVESFKR